MTEHLTVVKHPLVQHKLTLMREKQTSTAVFRQLLREISQLLAYEITRELPMTTQTIETPMARMEAPVLAGKKLALVSILRAGNGLLGRGAGTDPVGAGRVRRASTATRRRCSRCSITSRCRKAWRIGW